jgi:nucleotide-binding universal stress UspA family protein
VVLGLLISVPIVVWGSTLILRWVERFPAIVYVGAGVLAWTAASMMLAEPALKDWIDQQTLISPLTHFTVIGGVLWVGLRRNHRRLETRIAAHLKRLRAGPPHGTVDPVGEHTMLRLLVPIDGSANSGHAVRHVIKSFLSNPACEVHVLNVQAPLSRHIANVLRASDRSAWHRTRAEETLAPSVELLRQHGIPHAIHVRVGDAAHVIAAEAARLRCNRIVMATARKNSLTRMLQDSTTYRVLESTSIPVELVAGDAVSPLERWGVPAGIGALAAILLVAAD